MGNFATDQLTTLYFGYGAYRSKVLFEEILGHPLHDGYGAILHNYQLAYQTLNDIPEVPRAILQKSWGEHFRCYTIVPGINIVAGVIWELTDADLLRLKKWEFDTVWKEFIPVEVTIHSGKKINAITETSLSAFPITKFVDGLLYETNLNPIGRMVAQEFSKDELANARKMLEQLSLIGKPTERL